MTYQIRRSADSDPDPDAGSESEWLSYSGSSTTDVSETALKAQPRMGLLSKLRGISQLTSSSVFTGRRFKPKISRDDPALEPGLGPAENVSAAGAVPETTPSPVASSGRAPLQPPEPSNRLAFGSQLRIKPQLHVPKSARSSRRAPLESPTSTIPRDAKHDHGDDSFKDLQRPPLSLASSLRPHPNAHVCSETNNMDPNNPTQSPNLADLLTSLSKPEDASRKMAAFKLQSLINDPSFAEHFVLAGGLPRLRTLVLESTGNTLAYSLASFARLLEVDQGWEAVSDKVVEKVWAQLLSFAGKQDQC
jgi:hypothetical protein